MKVGIQLEANRKGVGVIGVIDADFLWPTHNKQVRKEFDLFQALNFLFLKSKIFFLAWMEQDFNEDKLFRGLIKRLAEAVSDFWWQHEEFTDKDVRRKIRYHKAFPLPPFEP